MKSLSFTLGCRLYFLCFVYLTLVSCVKDSWPISDELDRDYSVTFQIRGFQVERKSLGVSQAIANATLEKLASIRSSLVPEIQSGYLYFWSFNASSLEPDIQLNKGARITYNDEELPSSYQTGFAYEEFEAGVALNLTRVEQLVFEMPLTNAVKVYDLGFDVSSSNTGPKDFHLLYSNDEGLSYDTLSRNNQFGNLGQQQKNTFSYAIDTLPLDFSRPLWIKLVPLEGMRNGSNDYNPATGVLRIDNFRLSGEGEFVAAPTVRKLHYHIFDRFSKNSIEEGEIELANEQVDFSLRLPKGNYLAHFISNSSHRELLLPTDNSDIAGHYVANRFDNQLAQIYGHIDTLEVDEDLEIHSVLKRYYNQVKFEFTDSKDLSHITKIRIARVHEPLYFSPFNAVLPNPVLDQSEIEVTTEFGSGSKELVFNEFVGDILEPVVLQYKIEAFAEDELLRVFDVSAAVRNNTQLVFRGSLLEADPSARFTFEYNKKWGEDEEVIF